MYSKWGAPEFIQKEPVCQVEGREVLWIRGQCAVFTTPRRLVEQKELQAANWHCARLQSGAPSDLLVLAEPGHWSPSSA